MAGRSPSVIIFVRQCPWHDQGHRRHELSPRKRRRKRREQKGSSGFLEEDFRVFLLVFTPTCGRRRYQHILQFTLTHEQPQPVRVRLQYAQLVHIRPQFPRHHSCHITFSDLSDLTRVCTVCRSVPAHPASAHAGRVRRLFAHRRELARRVLPRRRKRQQARHARSRLVLARAGVAPRYLAVCIRHERRARCRAHLALYFSPV